MTDIFSFDEFMISNDLENGMGVSSIEIVVNDVLKNNANSHVYVCLHHFWLTALKKIIETLFYAFSVLVDRSLL